MRDGLGSAFGGTMPTTLSFVVVLSDEEEGDEFVFFFDFALDFAVNEEDEDEEEERSYSSSAPYTFL